MRPELNQYELIESYLTGSLSSEQRQLFEKQLSTSPELQEQVNFQAMAIQAAKRLALRSEILTVAAESKGGMSGGKIIGILIAVIAVGSILAYFGFSSTKTPQKTEVVQQEKNQTTKNVAQRSEAPTSIILEPQEVQIKEPAITTDFSGLAYKYAPYPSKNTPITSTSQEELRSWTDLKIQKFNINAKTGGTIEGKGGTLVIIPKNAFVDDGNNIIDNQVQFELIEALTWEDMIAYNLTPTEGSDALSSGGMVRVQAFVDGMQVHINPERPVYIEIPTDNFNPELQAYEGEVVNGTINWINPQPQKRFLTIVDMDVLNYLPEGFDKAVEAGLPYKNHKIVSSELVDSLYYALTKDPSSIRYPIVRHKKWWKRPFGKKTYVDYWGQEDRPEGDVQIQTYCYLDPISIQTIRTKKFRNSFVATKEFEARLREIHKLPENAQKVFDLYIDNLDRDMYKTDEKVARLLKGEQKTIFETFAAQKATNVKSHIYSKQLEDFYQTKRNELAYSQKKLREKYTNKTTSQLISELESTIERKNESLDDQESMEYDEDSFESDRSVTTYATYSTTWYKSSWMNVTSYIDLLEKGNSVEVVINAEDLGGEIKLYQSNRYLNTVVALNFSNGTAVAKFPDSTLDESKALESSYCIGINERNDTIYYAQKNYNPYETSNIDLVWEQVSKSELQMKLRALSSHSNKILEDLKEEEDQLTEVLELRAKQEETKKKRSQTEESYINDRDFIMQLADFINPCSTCAESENQPDSMP